MSQKKGGLGKGLDLIFMENDTQSGSGAVSLRVSEIEPNRSQPRREFNEEALAELADSISQHGVLQPLLVRPIADGGYQIVAGERRWRASRMAGISEVPVIIKEMSDRDVMGIALIENLQREDLSPVEEAMGYKTLMDTYDFTQDDVAKTVGKSRPAVTNALRLLSLPPEILTMVTQGKISAGHARTLLSIRDVSRMNKVAELIAQEGISVRELERLVKKYNSEKETKSISSSQKSRNSYFDEVELALKQHLGRKVKVSTGSKNRGVLQIEFYGESDLANLVQAFNDSY